MRCKLVEKSSCEYGIEKRKKRKKDANLERQLSMPLHLGMG
jgi:hypothetical protein